MLELIAQVLAYSAVGIVILVIGFVVIDALTPGKLGALCAEGNKNAGVLLASTLATLGLILFFAIHFTGAGWDHLDDAAIYGAIGVAIQAAAFFLLDLLTPGKLGEIMVGEGSARAPGAQATGHVAGASTLHAVVIVAVGLQFAVALIVCASLT